MPVVRSRSFENQRFEQPEARMEDVEARDNLATLMDGLDGKQVSNSDAKTLSKSLGARTKALEDLGQAMTVLGEKTHLPPSKVKAGLTIMFSQQTDMQASNGLKDMMESMDSTTTSGASTSSSVNTEMTASLSKVFGSKSGNIAKFLQEHDEKQVRLIGSMLGARIERGQSDSGQKMSDKLAAKTGLDVDFVRQACVARKYLDAKQNEKGPLLHYRVVPQSHLDNIFSDKALLSGEKFLERHPDNTGKVGGDIFMTRDGYNKEGRLTNDGLEMLTAGHRVARVANPNNDSILVFGEEVYGTPGYRPKDNPREKYPTSKEVPVSAIKCIIQRDESTVEGVRAKVQRQGLDIPVMALKDFQRQNIV